MNKIRIATLAVLSGLVFAVTGPAASPGGVADLRLYGPVSAEFSSSRVVFHCADETKADWLMGKLLADFFWDAGDAHHEKPLSPDNQTLVFHSWEPYGVFVAARNGRDVVVLGSENAETLRRLAQQEPLLTHGQAHFRAEHPYPFAMDFYDLRAFKSYVHPMASPLKQGLENHWPFVKRLGLGGTSFVLGGGATNPAPGVGDWSSADYEVESASRNGGMVVPGASGDGEVPLWTYNDFPNDMMQMFPQMLNEWNGEPAAGAHYLSWGAPDAVRDATSHAFLASLIKRYGSNPAVGGWALYAGAPGVEMGFHAHSTELWDDSLAGRDGFVHWLRDVNKMTLSQLGVRWFNNPSHFKSWGEVRPPNPNFFVIDPQKTLLQLDQPWSWRLSTESEAAPPPGNGDGWISVPPPPSLDHFFLPAGRAWYRTTFTQPSLDQKSIVLVYSLGIPSNDTVDVWLNGRPLGHLAAQNHAFISVDITKGVQAGQNELVLRTAKANNGRLFGPLVLMSQVPETYPHLEAGANARWVDLRFWQAYSVGEVTRQTVLTARRLDPDRPMVISPGASLAVAPQAVDLGANFGLGLQNTGREAYEFPYWPRMGYVSGFYGTSEPSNTVVGPMMDRMLGWMLIDGDSSHDLFWDLENYMQMESQSSGMTQRRRLAQLVGKSLPEKPSIALLHSAQNTLLGLSEPTQWDIGRDGELRAAHYDHVYVTEREIENGLVQNYPVLFDGGTLCMDDTLLQAIERYVRAGGTLSPSNPRAVIP